MSSLTVALFGATCSSLAFGYFLGKSRGLRRDAEYYIQKSARGSKQTDGLKTFLEYVAEHSSPEPHSVAELRKAIAEKIEDYLRMPTTFPIQSSFIAQLAKTLGARKVLEIGTLAGSTALSIALVLPQDGQMVTIDVNDDWVALGRPIWKKAGVSNKIKSIVKNADQALDELIDNGEEETFDMAYIDADKWNYYIYYDKCMQLVRKGGVILIDDTLWEGMVCDPKINRDGRVLEEGPLDYQNYFIDTWTKSGHSIPVLEKVAAHLHALNNRIANDPRVTATILPIGSGLTIATKL